MVKQTADSNIVSITM